MAMEVEDSDTQVAIEPTVENGTVQEEDHLSGDASASSEGNRRRLLYTLIIRQLQDDGHMDVASQLTAATDILSDLTIENHKLEAIVQEHVAVHGWGSGTSKSTADAFDGQESKQEDADAVLPSAEAVEPVPKFVTRFITTHKLGVRCAIFSKDGSTVATGSMDTSIKVLDVSKMHYHSQVRSESQDDYSETRPVIRTYYDHTEPINDLCFHPSKTWLLSASDDCHIKFFDTSKRQSKRSFRQIKDTHPVKSLDIHGSGAYLIAGTVHPMVRVYDIRTMKAFVSPDVAKAHQMPITSVRYNGTFSMYASASRDGNVRIWDTVNNKCVRSIDKAHAGATVNSVRFSGDDQWLLTSGQDGMSRLWHVATGQQMMRYEPTNCRALHLQADFDYSGNYVLTSNEKTNNVDIWNAWNGKLEQSLVGHNKVVSWVAVSPVEPCLLTCSDDYRARFWAATT